MTISEPPRDGLGNVIVHRVAWNDLPGNPLEWAYYESTGPIMAYRMPGPFRVYRNDTPEGEFCADGYVMLDHKGQPYAIDVADFMVLYRPVIEEDEDGEEDEG